MSAQYTWARFDQNVKFALECLERGDATVPFSLIVDALVCLGHQCRTKPEPQPLSRAERFDVDIRTELRAKITQQRERIAELEKRLADTAAQHDTDITKLTSPKPKPFGGLDHPHEVGSCSHCDAQPITREDKQ